MSRWPLIQILRKMTTCKPGPPPPPKDSKCAPCPYPERTIFDPHPDGGYKVYKNLFYILCVPAIMITAASIFCGEHEVQRPKFAKYPYLRLRSRRYPWGNGLQTFFHNPHLNALPDGYEEEDDDDCDDEDDSES